jgi:phage protein D
MLLAAVAALALAGAAEAQTLAHAELGKQQRNLLTAEGSTIGNPAIRVGTILTLENMGRFSGQYVVETARHDIGQAGYRTGFEMRQDL